MDVSSTEPLTVAFIGGSLTEGEVDFEGTVLSNTNLKWSNVVLKFLSGLFPFRPLKAVNVGLGGTGSEYGAVRFSRDVLSHEPDLIFIEFSVNDCPKDEADCNEKGKRYRQIYLESMIRQCMEAEKVPAVVYTHVPAPYEGEKMHFYRKGCEMKQEILDYYGIGTVDAVGDVLREFEARKAADPALTLTDFYRIYYQQYENGNFNPHPYGSGYLLFAMSIINALANSPDRYFRPFQMKEKVLCQGYEDVIERRYHYVSAPSDGFVYEGKWDLYTAEHPFVCDDAKLRISNRSYTSAHHFPRGVMQAYKSHGASFTFETEADRICMPHVSSGYGLRATVYANGAEVGRTGCMSPWSGMNYTGPWLELPKGKKRMRFVIDDATEEAFVFRFGYIVESFDPHH